MITPTEPLRSAYIVADIAMQDPVAISLQGELYALERRVLAEYNGDNTPTRTGIYLGTHTMIEKRVKMIEQRECHIERSEISRS